MKYQFLFLLLLSLQSSKGNSNYSQEHIFSRDTIPRDIPLNSKGAPRLDYVYKNKFEKILSLQNIEKGVDSVEIRIWFNYSSIDTSQLIIFQNVNSTWTADIYNFTYKSDPINNSIKLVKTCVEKKTPKSGWNFFIEKIYALSILTLPDQSKIPEYTPYTDGNGVSIELATPHKYRIFGYQLPYITRPIPHSVQNLQSIIRLVNDEFYFKPLRPLTSDAGL